MSSSENPSRCELTPVQWNLNLLERSDIASISETAKRVTGIPLMDELEQDAMVKMLE